MKSPAWRLLALAVIIVAGIVLARITGLWEILRDPAARLHALMVLRRDAEIWWVGPLFALVYAVAAGLGLPASALTLLGGAAFGFLRGVIWVSVGANLGASLAFLLARYLGRSALERVLGSRLGNLDRKVDADGFQGLLILRLLPIVPFNLLNYVAGLTAIPWREYASATALGILPGTVVYVLFSDALLSGSAAASRGALLRAGIAGMILVVFSLVTRQFLRRKRASSQS